VLPETLTRRKSSTVNELAADWDCDPQLIYRRIRRGKIRAFKVGGLWRIPPDEVDRIEATGPLVDEYGQPVVDDIEASIAALVAAAPPLDCGCRDPWPCRCTRPPLSKWMVDGGRAAAMHLLEIGYPPILRPDTLTALYRRGDDRQLVQQLYTLAGGET
jgi:excisionase family DNA binding protein